MNYLTSITEDDILILGFQVAAAIDGVSVNAIATEWFEQLESTDGRKLVIDFSSLKFLSSDLVGKLIEFRRFCLAKGVSLKLCCLPMEFKQVLKLTGLKSQFKIYHSQRGAIECFAADNFVARQQFFSRYEPAPSMAQAVPTPTLQLIAESTNTSPFGF